MSSRETRAALPLPADAVGRIVSDGPSGRVAMLRAVGDAGPSRHVFAVLDDEGNASDILIRIPASEILQQAETGQAVGLLDRTPTPDEWAALAPDVLGAFAAAEVSILGTLASALRDRLGDPSATLLGSARLALLSCVADEAEAIIGRPPSADERRAIVAEIEARLAAIDEPVPGDEVRAAAEAVNEIGQAIPSIVAAVVPESLGPRVGGLLRILREAARKAGHDGPEVEAWLAWIPEAHPEVGDPDRMQTEAEVEALYREVMAEARRRGIAID